MQDLTQLLIEAGVDLGGNVINAARGMSSDGEWIHGFTTCDPVFPNSVVEVPVLMSLDVHAARKPPATTTPAARSSRPTWTLSFSIGVSPLLSSPKWTNERPTSGIVDQAELDGVLLDWERP